MDISMRRKKCSENYSWTKSKGQKKHTVHTLYRNLEKREYVRAASISAMNLKAANSLRESRKFLGYSMMHLGRKKKRAQHASSIGARATSIVFFPLVLMFG